MSLKFFWVSQKNEPFISCKDTKLRVIPQRPWQMGLGFLFKGSRKEKYLWTSKGLDKVSFTGMNSPTYDKKSRLVALVLISTLMLGACATKPPKSEPVARAEYVLNNDPFEPTNRAIFGFNTFVDQGLVRPVAKAYNAVTPQPIRKGMTNFLDNLMEPWTFLNEILQGKPKGASKTLGRFAINSTVGLLGVWNPAKRVGLERHDEDFGQTLGVWGVPSGPYIVLPVFGPSNVRDTIGFTVEIMYDPMSFAVHELKFHNDFFLSFDLLTYIHVGLEALDKRSRYASDLDALYASPDPYALARSAYRQVRIFEIADGKVKASEEEDDLFDEDISNEQTTPQRSSPLTKKKNK